MRFPNLFCHIFVIIHVYLNNMQKFFTLFLFLCAFTQVSRASHEYAGQITAKNIGTSSYQIKITLWVDSMGLTINNLPYQIQTGGATTPESAALVSSTAVGNGILEQVYLDTLLANSAGNYKVVYSNCCRNGLITNLTNPTMAELYLYCDIVHNPIQVNSTPEFSNVPAFFSGVNDTLLHNPLAIDPDGDSLVFSWANPLGSGGAPIAMSALAYPSAPAYSFTVDPVVGEITWIPSMTGAFAYAVKVEEYRNGVLLSTSAREATVTICVGCKTAMASEFQFYNKSSWPQPVKHYLFETYANTPFNMTFSGGVSTINTNTLKMKIIGEQNQFANAPVFAPTQTGSTVSGNYSWTPTSSQIRNRPYLNVILGTEQSATNETRTKEHTLLFKVNATPSRLDDLQNAQVNVYPVPGNTMFYVDVQNIQHQLNSIEILNTYGQVIYSAPIEHGVHVFQIDCSSWASGTYILKTKGESVLTRKLTIQH